MYAILYYDDGVAYDVTNNTKTKCLSLSPKSLLRALTLYFQGKSFHNTSDIFAKNHHYNDFIGEHTILFEFDKTDTLESIQDKYPEFFI